MKMKKLCCRKIDNLNLRAIIIRAKKKNQKGNFLLKMKNEYLTKVIQIDNIKVMRSNQN